MAIEVVMQCFPGGLRAVNEPEASKLEGLTGKQVSVRISQPRNLQFHRFYFALLKTSLEMIPEDYNMEQFRAICTVGAGYCDFIKVGEFYEQDAKVVAIPKSIKFASMNQLEFEKLYQDTVTYICKRWCVDETFLTNLLEFM